MTEDEPDGGSADDPFEAIDAATDPVEEIDVEAGERDPFEQLAADRAGDPSVPDEPDSDPAADDADVGPSADTERGVASRGEADDPFAGLGRDERPGDPFADFDAEGAEPDRLDEDLWEDLSREAVEPETESHGQRRYAEVSKHRYCERCEYFSAPPDVTCSHEGTDIIEFVDSETIRLADCPVVAEREALADLESEQ